MYEYPYDKGYVENFKDVFGQRFQTWLIPTLPEGDGIYWNAAKSTDGKGFRSNVDVFSIIKMSVIYLKLGVFF